MRLPIGVWLAAGSTALMAGLGAGPAMAQAAYGSYVGVGGSFGSSGASGVAFTGRYRILEAPISIRAQALVGGGGVALVPTVSLDIPIDWQTEAYVGAGITLPSGNNTPVGDRASFAVQPGIDYSVPESNTVIFGNAVIAFNGRRDGGGTAISVQGGVGFQLR